MKLDSMDDQALLRNFACDRSEAAFAALVERYVNLVWSSARRQVRDASLADEIASAVFLVLAQKAGSLRDGTILSGWLLRTTRFIAANALRREVRRQHREEEVMNTLLHRSESDAAWNRIAPLLDEALTQLGDRDRDALALRFFDQRSFRDIGQALGTTEDNAQKRVSRALEKLRGYFARHGAKVPAAILAAALTGNCVQAAPAGLAATVTAAATSALAGGSFPALAQAAVEALSWARLKTLAWRGAAALGTVSAVLWLAKPTASPTVETQPPQPFSPAKPGPTPAIARAKSTASTAPAALPTADQLLFRVLDAESGNPVANAALTLVEITTFPRRSTNHFTTDRTGIARLPRPSAEVRNWSYRVQAFRDGYVPKYVSWSFTQGDLFHEIPLEHTTKLDRGTLIGGFVTGEAKEPIAGVKVVFHVGGSAPGAGHERERLTMMGHYHIEETDTQGRWRCNHVPAKFGMVIWELTHPDYQHMTYRTDGPDSTTLMVPVIPLADFLTQQAAMQMRAGIPLFGRVLDEAGEPIAGAKVTRGHEFLDTTKGANLLTDALGQFRFRNLSPAKMALTVAAKGFAPTNLVMEVQPGLAELLFTLHRGRLLRGRVVDEHGQSVANASVEPDVDRTNRRIFDWLTRTDADGWFRWDAAPAYPEKFVVNAAGYASKRGITLTADGTEQTVVLTKSEAQNRVRVTGLATDAMTRRTIEVFQVVVERPSGMGVTRSSATGQNGRYNFQTSGAIGQRFITEVRADGYLPVRVTNVVDGIPEQLVNFALTASAPITGAVLSSGGLPVSGATVALITGRRSLLMKSAGELQVGMTGIDSSTTDHDGKFTFQPRLDADAIVATHPLGFAEVSLSKLAVNRTVTLQPWGRIEGRLQSSEHSVANVAVRLQSMASPIPTALQLSSVSVNYETRTDEHGQFAFDRVPPGDRLVSVSPQFLSTKGVLVEPGRTANVVLGGLGRTVTGRVATNGLGAVNWQQGFYHLTTEPVMPLGLVPPRREDFATDGEFQVAARSFTERSAAHWATPEGRAALRDRRSYALPVGPDGSFRLSGVLSGTYHLRIMPYSTAPMSLDANGNPTPAVSIGKLEMDVTVAEISGATDTAPVDLGVLELKPSAPQKK
ncbi:MAG: sigma-70 family RNA polymerase sigma factor [Limisphaerales bacterium]